MSENKDNEEKVVYEAGYHLMPSIAEERLPETVLKIRDTITQNEGLILSEDFPVLKPLAYVISKITDSGKDYFNKAYFGWVKFEISKDFIGKIEKDFKSNKDILRFLVIKTIKGSTLYHAKPIINEERQNDKPKIIDEKERVVKEEEIDKSIEELII